MSGLKEKIDHIFNCDVSSEEKIAMVVGELTFARIIPVPQAQGIIGQIKNDFSRTAKAKFAPNYYRKFATMAEQAIVNLQLNIDVLNFQVRLDVSLLNRRSLIIVDENTDLIDLFMAEYKDYMLTQGYRFSDIDHNARSVYIESGLEVCSKNIFNTGLALQLIHDTLNTTLGLPMVRLTMEQTSAVLKFVNDNSFAKTCKPLALLPHPEHLCDISSTSGSTNYLEMLSYHGAMLNSAFPGQSEMLTLGKFAETRLTLESLLSRASSSEALVSTTGNSQRVSINVSARLNNGQICSWTQLLSGAMSMEQLVNKAFDGLAAFAQSLRISGIRELVEPSFRVSYMNGHRAHVRSIPLQEMRNLYSTPLYERIITQGFVAAGSQEKSALKRTVSGMLSVDSSHAVKRTISPPVDFDAEQKDLWMHRHTRRARGFSSEFDACAQGFNFSSMAMNMGADSTHNAALGADMSDEVSEESTLSGSMPVRFKPKL
ncbi:MAG: hypothetical protein HOI53_04750 [Francisellaceae bacterium]|jgi:hypothetical protein|nr:hypothetical protein [Francisellaceae bacterium]MBT6539762.1 hypothetical protein [Francisellaceae bacterium]